MKPEDAAPRRSGPIHQPVHWHSGAPVVLFVTASTKLRKQVLSRHDVHDLILRSWEAADDWQVGRYVIMPEHVHLLCSPRDTSAPLHRWMRYWRNLVSRGWPRPEEKPIWQRDYWDTQLRPDDSYAAKAEYIRMNPVRRGLVENPEDWSFAGEVGGLG